jgi:hypothetical protein
MIKLWGLKNYRWMSFLSMPMRKEAKAVQIETNNICRKYKEAAYMASITNPISQPSLEISPI